MQTVTARRMDDVLREQPARASIAILEEVLGVPGRPTAAVWIATPRRDLQRRFWKELGPRITRDHEVYVAEGMILAEDVRDIHERPLAALAGELGESALFFVDRDPTARWAHACTYVLVSDDGPVVTADHVWPPAGALRLVRLPRLAVAG